MGNENMLTGNETLSNKSTNIWHQMIKYGSENNNISLQVSKP